MKKMLLMIKEKSIMKIIFINKKNKKSLKH
jgi:hypothetical protein